MGLMTGDHVTTQHSDDPQRVEEKR